MPQKKKPTTKRPKLRDIDGLRDDVNRLTAVLDGISKQMASLVKGIEKEKRR